MRVEESNLEATLVHCSSSQGRLFLTDRFLRSLIMINNPIPKHYSDS